MRRKTKRRELTPVHPSANAAMPIQKPNDLMVERAKAPADGVGHFTAQRPDKGAGEEWTEATRQRHFQEFLQDAERAKNRLDTHRLFKVSLWEGVDVIEARARNLFDSIPPQALTKKAGASDRESFKHALNICNTIVMLAFKSGRQDLAHIAYSLEHGLLALIDRDRGFDEPLLRARPKLPTGSRESLQDWYVKAALAAACEQLKEFGVKDAARQVAEVINRNQLFPIKTNGKAVVARSVLNWCGRRRAGDFRPFWNVPGGVLFPQARRLWAEGKRQAARSTLLHNLPRVIKSLRSAFPSSSDSSPLESFSTKK
jgi:hypothetical protein